MFSILTILLKLLKCKWYTVCTAGIYPAPRTCLPPSGCLMNICAAVEVEPESKSESIALLSPLDIKPYFPRSNRGNSRSCINYFRPVVFGFKIIAAGCVCVCVHAHARVHTHEVTGFDVADI